MAPVSPARCLGELKKKKTRGVGGVGPAVRSVTVGSLMSRPLRLERTYQSLEMLFLKLCYFDNERGAGSARAAPHDLQTNLEPLSRAKSRNDLSKLLVFF